MKRSTAGFTLVELLLVILCSSVVTMAAMSFLLMGMRMTGESNDTAQRQQTARIILAMVENLGGEIQSVTEDADWKITGTGGSELLAYSNAEKKLTAHGMTLIDGLEEATAAMNGQLLSFTLKTGKGSYKTSVYCRTAPPKQPESGETLDPAEEAAFLTTFRSRVAEAAAANAQAAGPIPPGQRPPLPSPRQRSGRAASPCSTSWRASTAAAARSKTSRRTRRTATSLSGTSAATAPANPAGTPTPPGAPASSPGRRRSWATPI